MIPATNRRDFLRHASAIAFTGGVLLKGQDS